jgi:hypothetical protein
MESTATNKIEPSPETKNRIMKTTKTTTTKVPTSYEWDIQARKFIDKAIARDSKNVENEANQRAFNEYVNNMEFFKCSVCKFEESRQKGNEKKHLPVGFIKK